MIKSQYFHMKEVPPSSLFPLLPARGEKKGEKKRGGDGFLRRLTCHPLKSEKGDKKGEKKENIFGNIFLRAFSRTTSRFSYNTGCLFRKISNWKFVLWIETEGSCCEGNANIFRGIECCYAGTKGVLGRKGWGMFFIVPRHFL